MNDDHSDSTISMIQHYIGGDVEAAKIVSMDCLGMDVVVKRTPKGGDQPQEFKIRLPFVRKVEERKEVKEVIVQMTRESAGASK